MKPAIHKPDAGHLSAARAISIAEAYNFVCTGFKYMILGHIAWKTQAHFTEAPVMQLDFKIRHLIVLENSFWGFFSGFFFFSFLFLVNQACLLL